MELKRTIRECMSRLAWPGALTLVLAAIMAAKTWPVLAGLGDTMYAISGDGWKNIYTFVYHVLHDESAWHTTALHWPWGDHVAMSDAQPLLSNALRPLARWGVLGERKLTYLVLLLPIVSFVAYGPAIYAVLRALSVQRALAAAFSLPIALLQPQFWRYTAHYALAYAWVFPVLLLLWLRSRAAGYGAVACLWVGGFLVLAGFIHPYYLGLGAAMLLALLLVEGTLSNGRRSAVLRALLLQVLLPTILVGGYTTLSDTHTDRTAQPYGLFEYVGKPIAAVADTRLPHWQWLSEQVVTLEMPAPDGFVYLGLATLVGLLCLLVVSVLRKRQHAIATDLFGRMPEPVLLSSIAWAGLGLLVFSWGVPLALHGEVFDALREWSGPLRQLRALGRFGWPAYLLLSVLGAVTLSSLFARLGRQSWLVLLLLLVSTLEGMYVIYDFWGKSRPHVLIHQADAIRGATDGLSATAVLPLPYFSVGSEDFTVAERESGLYTGTYPSLATGLPNLGLYLSRTSFGETIQTVGLTEPWWNVNPILERGATGGQQLLVAVDKEAYRVDAEVPELVDPVQAHTTSIYESDQLSLRVLEAPALPEIVRAYRRAYLDRHLPEVQLDSLEELELYGERRFGFVRVNYDAAAGSEGIAGSGGRSLTGRDTVVLYEGALPQDLGGGGLAVFGAHLRLQDQGQIFSYFKATFLDATGHAISSYACSPHLSWVSVFEDWVHVEWSGEVPSAAVNVRLTAIGSQQARNDSTVVDEVTVRAYGTHFAYALDGLRVVDGRVFQPLAPKGEMGRFH